MADRHAIVKLHAEGLSTHEIAKQVGTSQPTVSRVLKAARSDSPSDSPSPVIHESVGSDSRRLSRYPTPKELLDAKEAGIVPQETWIGPDGTPTEIPGVWGAYETVGLVEGLSKRSYSVARPLEPKPARR